MAKGQAKPTKESKKPKSDKAKTLSAYQLSKLTVGSDKVSAFGKKAK